MISARTFRGGIHPLHSSGEGKRLTAALPVEPMTAPKTVCIPMAQHIGAPCVPCVAVGEHVKRGQKIGQTRSFVSAPVHASISGTVTEIALHLVVGGNMVTCVTIENDFADEWAEECLAEPRDLDSITAEEALNAVLEGGLVGMGGAAFPAHVKLSPPKDKKIDFLLVNGAECEPYLTADHRLMLEQSKRIIGGIRLFARILGNPRCIVGIEVCALKSLYPQGGEKQLIQAVTGRQVPSGKLPMDAGCVVANVSSAAAAYDSAVLRRPVTERVLTVTGAVEHPRNLLVRVGTRMEELVEFCGGLKPDADRVVSGGPMMGIALYDLSVPVVKGTSGVLALTREQTNPGKLTNCIRCGRCVRACPMHLMPFELCNDVERNDWQAAEHHSVLDCMECGSCTYVCPARRNITSSIRIAKRQVMALRKKQ